jgi:hypothetical protein
VRKGRLWAKHMGLKWGLLGTPLELKELARNMLGTKEKRKKSTPFPPGQNLKRKNQGFLNAC